MLRGGCFCRAVRYEIDAAPTNQTICHCTMCRHAAGAPRWRGSRVPPDSVRFVAGEPQRFKSSEHATRSFCPDCGTTLTYQSTRTSGDLDITTCSLDEPDQAAPRDHTFVRSKLSWVTIADGLAGLSDDAVGRRVTGAPIRPAELRRRRCHRGAACRRLAVGLSRHPGRQHARPRARRRTARALAQRTDRDGARRHGADRG